MSTNRSLLLVEDDPEDAQIFRRHLPDEYRLTHVATLREGLEALAAASYDACYVDYRLGADSGLELVRAVRAAGNPIAIVVTTGQDIELLGENALLAGATDFLPKADLCSAAIARVTRWAMIRQFAELKRSLIVSEAELRDIAQLARPEPRTAHSAEKRGRRRWLRQVIYISRAVTPFTPQALTTLCARAAENNRRIGVTGVLVCSGQAFLQVLEGEPEAIGVLMQRIQQDTRHAYLSVIADLPGRSRYFARWGMGCHARELQVHWTQSRWQVLIDRLTRAMQQEGPLSALPAHFLELVSGLAEPLHDADEAPQTVR